MDQSHKPSAEPANIGERQDQGAGPVYTSEALLQGGWVARIDHAGERYTLRLTRQGKLILTK
jgi:hemin uptake protein HemP